MPRCPKITQPAGSDAAIVEITGNPRNQEPTHMRIVFPGGEMELVRAADGEGADYWCHVRILRPQDDDVIASDGERVPGHVVAGRIDVKGKHASESDEGDLRNPDFYHLAVRVSTKPVAPSTTTDIYKRRRPR